MLSVPVWSQTGLRFSWHQTALMERSAMLQQNKEPESEVKLTFIATVICYIVSDVWVILQYIFKFHHYLMIRQVLSMNLLHINKHSTDWQTEKHDTLVFFNFLLYKHNKLKKRTCIQCSHWKFYYGALLFYFQYNVRNT